MMVLRFSMSFEIGRGCQGQDTEESARSISVRDRAPETRNKMIWDMVRNWLFAWTAS